MLAALCWFWFDSVDPYGSDLKSFCAVGLEAHPSSATPVRYLSELGGLCFSVYSILLRSILFYSILFHSIPSHPIPPHSIPFHSISFHFCCRTALLGPQGVLRGASGTMWVVESALAGAPWPGLRLGEQIVIVLANTCCPREAETGGCRPPGWQGVWGAIWCPAWLWLCCCARVYLCAWPVAPVSQYPSPRRRCWLTWQRTGKGPRLPLADPASHQHPTPGQLLILGKLFNFCFQSYFPEL